jgi:hypothetical protein
MFVHSTGLLLKAPADTVKVLEAEVKTLTGIQFRRVNRFILLAVCGAHQCAAGQSLGPDTAVWVTTENGTVGDTEKTLGQLFHQRTYPKPYNFINTMSNTASFYIAQSLKLESRNLTMACNDFAFERGASLVRADLRSGASSGALLGGVDEAVFSETRLQSKFGDRLVDGSAWLYVTAQAAGAIGEIGAVRSFASEQRAAEWVQKTEWPAEPVLAMGVRVEGDERSRWRSRLPHAERFDPIAEYGYFDSATAAGIVLFLRNYVRRTFLHIGKDLYGRYVLIIVKAF